MTTHTAGNVFNQINLQNFGPFTDAKFDIKPGLSVVYGLNRSGGKFSTNSNAAGKSFLFSSVSEILFESPIVGQKQDVIKDGTRSLNITIKDKDVVIKRDGAKIEVKVAGKLKKFRTATIAREYLKKIIPFSEEEYSTYIHLDARVSHPLVMGNSTDRKRFFTSFFGLDKMDVEKKLVQAKLLNLAKSKSAYEELYADYKKSVVDLIDKETNDKLKLKVKQGEAILVDLHSKNLELQEIKRLIKFSLNNSEMLVNLSVALHQEYTMESYDLALSDNKYNLKHNKEGLEAAKVWDQLTRDYVVYNKAVDNLSKLARKLFNEENTKKAKLGSERYLEAAQDKKFVIRELNTIGIKSKPKLLNKVEGNELDLLVLKQTYQHQLKHILEFKDGKCETCGQLVVIKNPEVIKRRLAAVSKLIVEHREYKEYLVALDVYKSNKIKITELTSKASELEVLIGKYERYYTANKELQNLPPEPADFEGHQHDYYTYNRLYEEDKERMQLLAYARPHLDTIIELMNLTPEQLALNDNSSEIQARINRIQNVISEIRAKISVQSVLRNKAKVTKNRLLELKELLIDEEPLKIILAAYADKGMKRNAIQSISNTLMKTVNKYAKSVFAENYEFEFKWDTSQLSLLVHRKFGNKVLTSDVRKLSGAESKLFTIILVLALLSFVPPHKRANILILDEPDANFSEETTEAFKKLLPVLLTVIPSIIVITPKSDQHYSNSQNYTVVKTNGVSTIHNGHPSTLHKKGL